MVLIYTTNNYPYNVADNIIFYSLIHMKYNYIYFRNKNIHSSVKIHYQVFVKKYKK